MFAKTPTTAQAARREAATQTYSVSDDVLIKQIAEGNKLAMRALFGRHQLKVYRFALRIVRDTALAEDVVSEAFTDAWQHAGRFEGRSSVSTWLLGIARHKALTACNRRPTESLDDEMVENVVDATANPEADLDRQDIGRQHGPDDAADPADHDDRERREQIGGAGVSGFTRDLVGKEHP